jgi:hypothetical protein
MQPCITKSKFGTDPTVAQVSLFIQKQCGILSITTSSIGYIFCHMLDDIFVFDAMNIDH